MICLTHFHILGSAWRNAQAEGEDPRRGKRTELDRILDRHSAIGELGRELDELAVDPARHAQLKLGGGSLRAFRLALFVWFGGSAVLFFFGVSGWFGWSGLLFLCFFLSGKLSIVCVCFLCVSFFV